MINNYFEISGDREKRFIGISNVYKRLIKSKAFRTVSSPHFSLTPTRFTVSDFEGKQYYIGEEKEGYDLSVERKDKTIVFFKVMSTVDSLKQANLFSILKSSSQMNLMRKQGKGEKSNFYAEIVFQALSNNPEILYCSFSSEFN